MLRGGYSKLCPGFRAGTTIVTWWLTTPTKATPYLLSQIRNDFFFKSIIRHEVLLLVLLVSKPPPPLRLLLNLANNGNDLSASGRFVFFCNSHSFSFFFFVQILLFCFSNTNFISTRFFFIISCFLLAWYNRRFSQFSGLTMLTRTRKNYVMEEIHINMFMSLRLWSCSWWGLVICHVVRDTWQENCATIISFGEEFIDSANMLWCIYRASSWFTWRLSCCSQLGVPPVVHLSALGYRLDLTGSWWCKVTACYEQRQQNSCSLIGENLLFNRVIISIANYTGGLNGG